ncbi:MAG: right-handed parallel beta-helix repeat-containing protein, partial [Candidatus Hydrogenedentes bacterium]|nr:right-handed parallel beta-helix repeat-containing protein [Candidatus Hydrogenedentota bacterium]
GGEDNGVDGCLLYNLGYGGIGLSGGDRKTLTAAGQFATNNEIHDFSRAVRTYTPAVSVGGVGNIVAHNLIYNSPHMAIGLGGNDHRIEYNEIHHVCLETHDAGAFYMGRDWTQRGNIVRYNFMHEMGHGDVQAVYLDDWTSGTLVYGNILQGARRGVLNGGGRDNIVENNIFIDCGAAVHIDERGKGWAKGYFDGTTTTLFDRLKDVNGTEPPYGERYPQLAMLLQDDPVSAKGNIVRRNISVNSKFLELYDGLTPETPYLAIESNLVDVDPLFVDPANKNYRLRDDSPAFQEVDFTPIPCDKIGPQRAIPDPPDDLVQGTYKLRNVVPPLDDGDDPRATHRYPVNAFPMADTLFVEQVRLEGKAFPEREKPVAVKIQGVKWSARPDGLYRDEERHPDYGVNGPLSTRITALAVDSKENLWVGTPLGLSVRDPQGMWRQIRGKEGLPYEDVTTLAFDAQDRLWIGTIKGVIHYRPYEEGRQWFYRQGPRYLLGDNVVDIAVTPDGKTAYILTDGGLSALEEKKTTLFEKAETIERLVNERHRRLGLVADCLLDNADNPTSHTIGDNDNDGLWTAYHVAAMSLAYATTGNLAYRDSAKESMHGVILLQNASGTPGLVARSVLPAEEGKTKGPQWRPTPDGTMYWTGALHLLGTHRALHSRRTRADNQADARSDQLYCRSQLPVDRLGRRAHALGAVESRIA